MALIINTPETSFGVAFPQSYARIMAFTQYAGAVDC